MEISKIVFHEIDRILKRKGLGGGSKIRPSTPLFSSRAGLDSLDIAELIIVLEKRFRVDPFLHREGSSIKTLGHLIDFYFRHIPRPKRSPKGK